MKTKLILHLKRPFEAVSYQQNTNVFHKKSASFHRRFEQTNKITFTYATAFSAGAAIVVSA